MQHIEELSASSGAIRVPACALHEVGICCGEILVSRISQIVTNEACGASAPNGATEKRANAATWFEKSKQDASCIFG